MNKIKEGRINRSNIKTKEERMKESERERERERKKNVHCGRFIDSGLLDVSTR